MFKRIAASLSILGLLILGACSDDATVASRNLSKAADMFEIERRVVFINGITGQYLLVIEGKCAIKPGQSVKAVTVTCKVGDRAYKKHYLGLSDNVTFIVEQMKAKPVSVYHYRVIFKPQTIVPDIDARGSVKALRE
jgi:hypothetical protein